MKFLCTIFGLFALMLCFGLTAPAQSSGDVKRFEKDGLVFEYPNAWTVTDQSDSDMQQLTLTRNNSEAQYRVLAHRGKVDTPEKLAEARKKIVDPYVEAIFNDFAKEGAKPTRSAANIQVGTAQAEGVRIKAVLDSVPGEAAIYWLTLNNRLVILITFGPDNALKQTAPDWDKVRNSLRIEDKKAAEKAAPK